MSLNCNGRFDTDKAFEAESPTCRANRVLPGRKLKDYIYRKVFAFVYTSKEYPKEHPKEHPKDMTRPHKRPTIPVNNKLIIYTGSIHGYKNIREQDGKIGKQIIWVGATAVKTCCTLSS